jgi:hypothetical protein
MQNIKQIRNLIGENHIEQAIQLLLEILESSPEQDLFDQMILQKSRWADYKRKHLSGFGDDKEINAIRSSMLDIARELENRKNKPAGKEMPQTTFTPPVVQQTPVLPPPIQQPYIAQCFFNGDPNVYYVQQNNQVVVLNLMTNLPVMVAMRVVSALPAYAWFYQFPNGLYYSIDHAAVIWGVNAFGMPVQMGYVHYL